MKKFINLFLVTLFLFNNCSSQEENPPKVITLKNNNYEAELIIDGLSIPWGMDFISSNDILITEKSGKLFRVINYKKYLVEGVPPIYYRDQGGLLDVAIHPEFKKNKLIYLTMSTEEKKGNGGNTALYLGKLEGTKLSNIKLLYKGTPNSKSGKHWGSRIVFDNSGHLFFSIGDRGNRDKNPQDIYRDGGKIYRLNIDGTIPSDNPFISVKGAKSAIFSLGHRNPQGLTINPITGALWAHEHGPRGGDEINLPEKGKNYGWPKITYGINYIGTKITDETKKDGLEQPIYHWTPSIAPSGMTFLTSEIYPKWKNNLFVGSLKFQYLERLVINDKKVIYREKLFDKIGRVRTVKEGPDGFLYFTVENKGVFRIVQKK